jgi:hypothetical protein
VLDPSHEGGFEMRRRASRRDEEVELSENLIRGRLNGDRRGGDEPDFTEIGIVLRNRSGKVVKVLRPYRGDFREVFDGEAARIISLDFERVLATETEEPCALAPLDNPVVRQNLTPVSSVRANLASWVAKEDPGSSMAEAGEREGSVAPHRPRPSVRAG